jgi:hypothetical protein
MKVLRRYGKTRSMSENRWPRIAWRKKIAIKKTLEEDVEAIQT